MSARTDICNMALTILGAGYINSLDDEGDKARALKSVYYFAKDAVLEDANWSFAIKRFIPAENTAEPIFGWTYSFTIPPDILRVVRVLRDTAGATPLPYSWYEFPEEHSAAHVIEGNEILCNDSPIYCYGVRKMEDEGGFSPLFAEAFAAKLAFMTAQALTGSNTKQQLALGMYMGMIKAAKSRDGQQNTTRRMRNRVLSDSR